MCILVKDKETHKVSQTRQPVVKYHLPDSYIRDYGQRGGSGQYSLEKKEQLPQR